MEESPVLRPSQGPAPPANATSRPDPPASAIPSPLVSIVEAEAGASPGSSPGEQLAALLRRARQLRSDVRPVEVVAGLYLGSMAAAGNAVALRERHVTGVLCLIATPDVAPGDGPERLVVPLADRCDTDLRAHFDVCFEFIDRHLEERMGSVLVHCYAGVSRSVAVVVAYLMWRFDCTFVGALEHVRRCRPPAQPNPGFCLALRRYEAELRSSGRNLTDGPLDDRTTHQWPLVQCNSSLASFGTVPLLSPTL
eukprot:EG_transcript_21966